MQLEQMMGYQLRAIQERQTTYFVVGDLEGLSAVGLYSKEKTSNYDEGVDPSSDGPTLKFYNYLNLKRFGETELGIQMPGESHEAYKERMQSEGGITLFSPTIRSGSG